MNLHVSGNHGGEARKYEWGKVDQFNLEYKMIGLGKIKMCSSFCYKSALQLNLSVHT